MAQLHEVKINGFSYFADINNKILYESRNKKNGTPFSFLTKNETQQLEKEIRFPRTRKELSL
jgi:hypothetical protein